MSQRVHKYIIAQLWTISTHSPRDSIACICHSTIYVGNLPYEATDEQLKALFKDEGLTPISVRIPIDRVGIDSNPNHKHALKIYTL